MCYNVTYIKRKVEKIAAHKGIPKNEIPLFPETYWANGFGNPQLPVITSQNQKKIELLPWGLIPFWTKTSKDAVLFQRKHLNARDDSLFSSGVWREPIKTQRCIVCLHGFYEYHHVGKTKIPYLITMKDDRPMLMAGIWDHWLDKENKIERKTISIVTTEANQRMSEIHNNPDVLKRGGARMPLILPEDLIDQWLNIKLENALDKEELTSIMLPLPDEELNYQTVGQLAGKNGIGNNPSAWEAFSWIF